MKLKLAVITLFVLGCSAAFAQHGSATLCFEDFNGTPACNYEQLQWNGWLLVGEENESNCGGTTGQIIGSKVASLTGTPVSGLVYAYTDILFDDSNPGEQFFVLTQTVPSTRLNHYGWASYIGSDGDVFLGNYGYLYACTPGLAPISNQRTYTAAQEALRNKTIHK